MRRFLLAAACGLVALGAYSQGDASIWKNNKGITIGFITHQSLNDDNFLGELGDALSVFGLKNPFQYNSSYGFSLTSSNTYLWPSGEGWAGNRIKVGVDVRWFDVSFVKYNKYPKIGGIDLKEFYKNMGNVFGGNDVWSSSDYDNWDDWGDEGDYDDGYDDYIDSFVDKIGNMQVQIGMGVGPQVSIAPLAHLDNGARFLRVNIYGHFDPQASVVISKDYQGDLHGSWAFLPTWDFGGNIQWKNFVVGVEGRWGSAKYSDISQGGDYGYEDELPGLDDLISSRKVSWRNASFRVNVGFRF